MCSLLSRRDRFIDVNGFPSPDSSDSNAKASVPQRGRESCKTPELVSVLIYREALE
jgi:hypothetical protein